MCFVSGNYTVLGSIFLLSAPRFCHVRLSAAAANALPPVAVPIRRQIRPFAKRFLLQSGLGTVRK